MMMIRSIVIALVASVVSFAGADGQDSRLDTLDIETRRHVQAIVDSAVAAGLPAEPLVDQALKGNALKARGPQIVAAVRVRSRRVATAQRLLGKSPSEGEIVAALHALENGIRPQIIEEIRQRRPSGSILIPLGLLADFVARQIPADTVGNVLLTLIKGGMVDDELAEFRRMVDHDIAVGNLPSAALVTRANAQAEFLRSLDAAAGPPKNNPPIPPSGPIPPTKP